jgi:hypothetical protein
MPSSDSDFSLFLICVDQVRATASAARYDALWATAEGSSPVEVIRELLAKCPDESTAEASAGLEFITDTPYRESLRTDLGAVNRAVSNGEWKVATVLAGSIVEAVLLWAIRTKSEHDIQQEVNALLASGRLMKKPTSKPEHWSLSEMIEVACHCGLISEATACQSRLAKDFRNLIHAGRAIRSRQECNRGTAFTAVAAVEHVVVDLGKRFVV